MLANLTAAGAASGCWDSIAYPTTDPTVTDLQLGAQPTATITDCVDATHWQPVFVATGKSAAAPNQPTRLVTVSTAFTPEGVWLIRTFEIHRDEPC